MEPLYLTQVVDGNTLLYEVNYKSTVPQEVLVGVIRVQEPTPFRYDGRDFTHTIYSSGTSVVNVIECKKLRYQMPLRYEELDDKFYIDNGEGGEKQQAVTLEDVIIISHGGSASRSMHCLYLATRDKKAALATNVFSDGRMCFHGTFAITCPPENIIATIESAEGNNHLLTNYSNGNTDERSSEAPIYKSGGDVCLKIYDKKKLNHEQTKYLQHIT